MFLDSAVTFVIWNNTCSRGITVSQFSSAFKVFQAVKEDTCDSLYERRINVPLFIADLTFKKDVLV